MNRRVLAIGLVVTAIALVATCDALVLVHHLRHWPHGYSYWLEGSLALPIWVSVGLLITFRVPGNALGWLALLTAMCDGVQLSSGSIATYLAGAGPTTTAVNVLAGVSAAAQDAVIGCLIAFAYFAPTGRLLSARWRPMFAAVLAAVSIVTVNNVLTDSGLTNEVAVARGPLGSGHAAALQISMIVANVTMLIAIPAAVVGLVLRYRRGGPVQRQQMKWLLLAALLAVMLVVGIQPLADRLWPGAELPGTLIWAVIGSCLPAGIAVGVLRYRLYDVDRILSRTVSYLFVTGGIVAVYVAAIAFVDGVLQVSSTYGVAASTLAAAAAFQPLRRRVQRVVDRRFNRAVYDARRTVEVFASRLRDAVDTDVIRGDLLGTVSDVVAPRAASLWLVHP